MIDRYGVQHQSDGKLGLGLAPEGKWVKYEDYEAEVAELKERLRLMMLED